jgi:hypothetical protein
MNPWKSTQQISIWVIITGAALLTGTGMLGIWEVIRGDALEKALVSMGLIALTGLAVNALARFGENHARPVADASESTLWLRIRQWVLASMIALTVVHAAIVLAGIWFVTIEDLYDKALSSFLLLLVGAVIITLGIEEAERRLYPSAASAARTGDSSTLVLALFAGAAVLFWVMLLA